MELHLYSVKAKSQKQVVYESKIWQYKKAEAARYSARDLKNLWIQQRALGPGESATSVK